MFRLKNLHWSWCHQRRSACLLAEHKSWCLLFGQLIRQFDEATVSIGPLINAYFRHCTRRPPPPGAFWHCKVWKATFKSWNWLIQLTSLEKANAAGSSVGSSWEQRCAYITAAAGAWWETARGLVGLHIGAVSKTEWMVCFGLSS